MAANPKALGLILFLGACLIGINAPEAPENAQLLLNVMHWLTGKLP